MILPANCSWRAGKVVAEVTTLKLVEVGLKVSLAGKAQLVWFSRLKASTRKSKITPFGVEGELLAQAEVSVVVRVKADRVAAGVAVGLIGWAG